MLSFREETHEYFWHGERVPNVTSIIHHLTAPLYARIEPKTLERARQEGVAIHKMVEAYVKGTLTGVPDWMKGRLTAFERFLDETGFDPWAAEVRVFHEGYRYAGTMDLAGVMPKLKRARPAVIDVKRSLYGGAAIGLQTEGYRGAANHAKHFGERLEKRYALQLNDSGTYRLEEYDDVDDAAAFMACLQQLKWRAKHGQSRAGFGADAPTS